MPGVAKCRECGEEIWWHPSRNGRVMPPMETTGEMATLVIEGVAYTGKAWHRHQCTEEQQRSYALAQIETAQREAAERAEAAERRAQASQHAVAVEAFSRVVYRLSMERACPKCGAEAGQPCENLNQRRAKRVIYTANPHYERDMAIPRDEHPYWTSYTEFVIPTKEEKSNG